MTISIFDLFSIGIGPSSSHTVGPMRAAFNFVETLFVQEKLTFIARLQVDLYGSLALTGKGHGTDTAILNGLEGKQPKTVDPDLIVPRAQAIVLEQQICLFGRHSIAFAAQEDLRFHMQELLPAHTNGMRFTAFDGAGQILASQEYYSIGGGFIVTAEQFGQAPSAIAVPYPFTSAQELLAQCRTHNLSIRDLMFANEQAWRSPSEIRSGLLEIAQTMRECIQRGCMTEGILPGGLNVKRRAPGLYQKLMAMPAQQANQIWPTLYAMAVNEENAAGKRIVTAPTNGAAGIIPAVLHYYLNFYPGADEEGVLTFLLTAGAIAILYKLGASISGAEVGCQGEVGVACSMATAAMAAVMGGSLEQIENAAEMAMEHHLGMTCDPVGGLVQIPCIERNGVAAEKAIKLANLALLEDGQHKVSLDKVIATMLQIGRDMQPKYKETSLGGLAKFAAINVGANIPEC